MKVTFTPDMVVKHITLFLNGYNSVGMGRAQLGSLRKLYWVLLGWHQQRHPKSQSLEQILQRPSSIVRCLCLIGLWLQCLFPHRLPNSHTGNRQYKHGAQQILSCLDWAAEPQCKHMETLASHFENVCKTMSHRSSRNFTSALWE